MTNIYILIFEYSNILVTNMYSDIHSYQFFFYEYIRTFVCVKFVCTNIFGHSYNFIRWTFEYIRIFIQFSMQKFIRTFIQNFVHEYVGTFVCVNLLIQIYLDIRSCNFFDPIIFEYLSVPKYSWMSHSAPFLNWDFGWVDRTWVK